MIRQALVAMATGAALAISAPAMAQNWNSEVSVTERGHLVGNPDAAIKLITLVSYSCPACKRFEQQSEAELKISYIHTGTTSVEIRPVIHSNIDLAAALLVSCGPVDRFLANHQLFYATQDEWLAKARATTPAQRARWQSGYLAQQMRAVAADLDFYELMEARGYSTTELDACLGDERRAVAISSNAAADGVEFAFPGTPSFVVNGALLADVYSWEALKPVLVPEQL